MVFVSFPRFHRIIIQGLLAPRPLKQLQAKIVATDSLKKKATFSMEYRAKIACFRTQTSQIRTKIKKLPEKNKSICQKNYLNYARDTCQNYLKD